MLQCVPEMCAFAQAAQNGGQSALEAEHAQLKHELKVLGLSPCSPETCTTSVRLRFPYIFCVALALIRLC